MKPVSDIKLRAKPQIITLKWIYTEENTWQQSSESPSGAFAESAACATQTCVTHRSFSWEQRDQKTQSPPKCSTASSWEKVYNPINATNSTAALPCLVCREAYWRKS